MAAIKQQFESIISQLTKPLNGQLPRAWMTELADPLSAKVFVVGKNQAKGYDAGRLSHERHVDALFNRNGESCRRVYDEMTGFSPSRTRQNTDYLRLILAGHGVTQVLETNVVCYSTPMSSDLRLPQHHGGTARGTEIFRALLHFINPKVLIAHGSGTRSMLGSLLGAKLPSPPESLSEPQPGIVKGMKIFVIPSLAPPQWNQWHKWAGEYLQTVAKAVACAL